MKYYAFISYRRKDEKWAIWCQKKLERYRLPSVLCRELKIPRSLKPVCRDMSDLSTGMLIDILHEKLDDSRFLIVICSPEATRSEYVNQEIEYFASRHGKDKIFPLVVGGVPYSNGDLECYPKALRDLFPDGHHQLLGANIAEHGKGSRYMKRQRAFIMILSRMLGVSFDTLWKRHKRYLIRKLSANLIMFCLMLAFPFAVWTRTREFDINVSVSETAKAGAGLPAPAGVLTLYFESDSLTREILSFDEPLCFNNLPGTFRGRPVRAHTRIFGFNDADTVLTAERTMSLEVVRNAGCFGHIEGIIRNSLDSLVSGARITVLGISRVTGPEGRFVFDIPLEMQQKTYDAVIEHDGIRTNIECVPRCRATLL